MFVYFVQVRWPSGPVRIGHTKTLHARLALLQALCPYRLRLIRTVRGGRRAERRFFKRFEKQRMHADWFRFSPDMLTVSVVNDRKSTISQRTPVCVIGCPKCMAYLEEPS